ncbi:hypothetical protein CDAR_275031 [Caerostris darwini]|uniref:Uncharacterized protein n=1 Tax=Caerostris darwini TaxID=1538125 RepID=A0AAV4PI54_9ARAC|nr:hypothetical protein CDAR_275031 [Caerostris darwini]
MIFPRVVASSDRGSSPPIISLEDYHVSELRFTLCMTMSLFIPPDLGDNSPMIGIGNLSPFYTTLKKSGNRLWSFSYFSRANLFVSLLHSEGNNFLSRFECAR